MRLLGSVLQLLGLAGFAAGWWLFVPWVGVVVGAAALFAVGYQLEALYGAGD